MTLPPNPHKKFYLLPLDTFSDFRLHYDKIASKSFAVLFLNNQKITEEEISKLAVDLIDRGLAILSAWGKDTDEIEQLFDYVCVEKYMDADDERFLGLLTTSEGRDPLDETLTLFTHIDPCEEYEDCNTYILAMVGKKDWREKMEKQIKEFFSDSEPEKELRHFKQLR